MYQPHCNLEDKYLILKESHSNLKQLRHYKRECNICPMNFADIKNLMLMFRLPEDYYTELCNSRSLNIVVQSIHSLPWLSLKLCQVNTSPFHFVHKQWMQTAKSMVMRDRQLHDHTGRYLSTPYLNAKANRSEQDSNTGQLLKYFMTIKMSHPISDIPFRTLSFTSSLVNSVFVGQGNTYADMSSFSDLVDFSYVCRDFMAYREQFVPGITCLVHLELCVIPLQNTISFSALVYLPEARDIKQSEYRKVQIEQYVAKIQVNDDVRVTLLFKSSKMPVNIGGISQTEASFTYNKSSHQEERKTLNGFSLSEAYVELFMEPRKSNSGSRDNGYTFNRAGGVPETIAVDNYTINNTQNNYYFPEIRDHPESGINNLQPDVQPKETRAYCDKHNDLNHPYQTQDLAGRSHHASEYGDSHIDYGYHSHTGNNGFNTTNNRPNKNRSTNKQKTLKSGGSGSVHFNSQIQKGASKYSDEGMSEENEQNNSKLLPTVGDLIKDSKLLKSYANSKSKGIVLQNLLADLKDDQVPQLLTTLTPVIKDICKNKHGNYFAQTAIKMLPANCIADYLKLLQPSMIQVCCHPKGTFAIQGIIVALKAKSDQEVLVEMIKGNENDLIRNKDGSYIIKEIYRNFDRSLSKKITEVFMTEFQVNITDKYAICIFKKIAQAMSEDMGQLDELLEKYLKLFPLLKLDTFYHFGLQYFLGIYSYKSSSSARLAEALIDFIKSCKQIMRSRPTSETVLLSLQKPPTDEYKKTIIEMILKKTYIKRISDFKESPTFFASLRERLGSKEAAILDSLLSGLEQSCPY